MSTLGSKRGKTKSDLNEAYARYKDGVGSVTRLLALVKDFAYKKLYYLEREFKSFGTSQTVDDWAQDVVVSVWQGLDKFDGEVDAFYSWVHKIIFNKSQAAFNYVLDERDGKKQKVKHVDVEGNPIVVEMRVGGKVQLEVEVEDDDGESYTTDNPLLHDRQGGRLGSFPIPEEITGDNLMIVNLIAEGRSYEEIADFLSHLNLTPQMITMRMQRLKKQLKPKREAEKKANVERAAAFKEQMEYKTRRHREYIDKINKKFGGEDV